MAPTRPARETWSYFKANTFLQNTIAALAPSGTPKFKAVLATGRQINFHIREAQPDDFWIVFDDIREFRHRKSVYLHQSAFRGFMEVVKADRCQHPSDDYGMEAIATMVGLVRTAVHYEIQENPMSKQATNTIEFSNIRFTPSQILAALFVLATVCWWLFGQFNGVKSELKSDLASKQEVQDLKTSMDSQFATLNERLDLMGAPKVVGVTSTGNHSSTPHTATGAAASH